MLVLLLLTLAIDISTGTSMAKRRAPTTKDVVTFNIGDTVEVNYRGGGKWYPATYNGFKRGQHYVTYHDAPDQGEFGIDTRFLRQPRCRITRVEHCARQCLTARNFGINCKLCERCVAGRMANTPGALRHYSKLTDACNVEEVPTRDAARKFLVKWGWKQREIHKCMMSYHVGDPDQLFPTIMPQEPGLPPPQPAKAKSRSPSQSLDAPGSDDSHSNASLTSGSAENGPYKVPNTLHPGDRIEVKEEGKWYLATYNGSKNGRDVVTYAGRPNEEFYTPTTLSLHNVRIPRRRLAEQPSASSLPMSCITSLMRTRRHRHSSTKHSLSKHQTATTIPLTQSSC